MTQPRNPFEHHHDHGDGHDHDDDILKQELDPAQQSLADALRVSFLLLKIVMLGLVIAYLFTGMFSVASNEVALRLRFGNIVGEPGSQIIQPGSLHFAWPYPIEEVIKIPIAPQRIDLSKEFWFETTAAQAGKTIEEQAQGKSGPLNPEKDGSLLTGDANIIHARWSLSYRVSEPLKYAQNVRSLTQAEALVRAAAEEGVVLAIAQRTADELIKGQVDHEKLVGYVQTALNHANAGIMVEPNFSLSQAIIPLSVRTSYEAVIRAESERAQAIEMAQQERSKILGETAGEASRQLNELVRQYELATTAEDAGAVAGLGKRMESVFNRLEAPRWAALGEKLPRASTDELWAILDEVEAAKANRDTAAQAAAEQKYAAAMERLDIPRDQRGPVPVSGKVAEAINNANSYRSTAVGEVQRQATIFKNWYDVYKGNPATKNIVMGKLWQEAKAEMLTAEDTETIYLPPGQPYLTLSRDPDVTKHRQEMKLKADQEAQRQEAIKRAQSPPPPPPSMPSPPSPPSAP